jgi:phosphoglucosamine mutase
VGRLFGTDGIRGVAGRDLTAELAMRVGRASVRVLGGERARSSRPTVVVGRDPRASGEFLEAALVAGICSAGGDALQAGVTTTPAVAFLASDLGADAGVVISASHNPPGDNGIKFFGPSGYKLPDRLEDEIERRLDEQGPPVQGLDVGRVRPVADAASRYLEHVVAAAQVPLRGMRLVVDPANGAASGLAPEAYRRLGAEVHPINDRPDGTNINIDCGATHPEVVAEAVVALGADAGVAHDGDADRVIFADAAGSIVDGDHVLAACALALHRDGRLAKDTVVTTVMANLGFHRAMEEAGINVVETAVGDRYVLEEMLRTGAILGGEQSGHMIFAEHATTGDGILTAVAFLSLARAAGVTVADLAALIKKFPQVLVNVEVSDRAGLRGSDEVWSAVRKVESALGERGRILVRASGTEPLVRVMVEAESADDAGGHADAVAEAVRRALG